MWLKDTSPPERRVLGAAFAGYGVDAFDYMIYTFLIPTLTLVWGLTKVEAGNIATAALVTSAIGGWAAGILADRYGRVVILQATVAWFTVFTVLSGFTHLRATARHPRPRPAGLRLRRGMVGRLGADRRDDPGPLPGQGGRARAIELGGRLGLRGHRLLGGLRPGRAGPGVAHPVLAGAAPSILIFWIRRNIEDPEVYRQTRAEMRKVGDGGNFLDIFSRDLIGRTALASLLATGMQGGYYAVTTWLPTYLKTERNLSVLNTSATC